MKDILGLILAGGRVDELGVLTFFRPKSVMPFGGAYRIIDFPMSSLMHSGIENVGIFSQYRSFPLMKHIANGAPWDMSGRDRFAVILPPYKGMEDTDWYKGTADAVYQNIDFIRFHKPRLVVILSGDHIYRMDYRELIRFHLERKADVTVAFTRVRKEGASRFGLADIADDEKRGGEILDYVEKPEKPPYDWASLTVYIFRTDLLIDVLKENARKTSHEFGRDIIRLLVGNCRIYGYKHFGYWGYTRTPEEYWQTNMDLLGSVPKIDLRSWEIMTNLSHDNVQDYMPAKVSADALIEDSLFYSGCEIKGKVVRSVLFPGVRVDKGAVIEDSVVFHNTWVREGSRVCRTIADNNVVIGEKTVIGGSGAEALTIIGSGTRVPSEIELAPDVVAYPNLGAEHFIKSRYERGETIR